MDSKERNTRNQVLSQSKSSKQNLNKSSTFSKVKSLAKQFMYDPSVFTYSDPNEPERGPGSYELPPLIGSIKKHQTIVSKSPQRALPYNCSPGVCYYDPKVEQVFNRSPTCALQKEMRFQWQSDLKKRHIPLMYEANINTKLKRHGVYYC